MDIQEKIINALESAGKPMRPGEVAEALQMDKKDVEKAIKKMKDAEILHSPKRCYYDINR
jgi:Mn-dependent DtxR family transcriptional regulator